MSLFGFDTSDPAGLQKAIKAAQPLMDEVENRLEGIISSNLDRLDGATITATFTINLKPDVKAEPVT